MQSRRAARGCVALLMGGAALVLLSLPAATQPLAVDKAEILANHNRIRALLGEAPLRWSDKLAQGATQWAKVISALNRMQHSGTPSVGENLAIQWGDNASLTGMIAMWIKERDYFKQGIFPSVSSTGDWESVAHYTQMIWRNTTEVGCGVTDNGHTNFLVCWYNPSGNFIGQAPY